MSDNVIFAGQHNVYQKLRGLWVNMIDQLDCNCCWAITVAATATSDYYRRTLLRKHQLSPQDILDRVWYYYYEDVKNKKRDTAGCFQCGLRIPFELVRDKGVGFLEDYPFEAKLNEKKDPVQKSEYPRIVIEDFQMRMTKLKVFEALTVETRIVIGVIDVTNEFCDYKGVL
ncbi:hypothetical protein POM88_027863 [Heracleum sosnowskyi]|uniref:Peptidase C1A papain C-terminal domain-containing protein n=1 Tax=Heracleum sosnowskyi TaxID=360622 RepID=A0AAD8I9S4_9APIA|nr:hypothetical protein POM88_027863 [Heracleum sosnowskyi]